MRPRAWLLLLAAASAVAWVQLDGVHWAARAWSVVLLVVVPAAMIVQGRALREMKTLARAQAYISSIISLWVLGIATYGVALVSGYGLDELGLVLPGAGRALLLALLLTLGAVAVLFLFHFAGMREAPIMHELVPATPRERGLFVAVSISAGVCEEVIYRGFLIHVLYGATGSILVALLLSSGAFGVSHAYQQPAGALRATLLGIILAVPLLLDGSILPAILAHAGVDILSGLWLAKYLLR
ncbi:MAG TPA: CPBP family intramembrane glutamic endopeptidase [Longimicrobiales bacterium]